ncbi:MAG: hypothetical protein AB7U81_13135 [Thiohalomonadaceae bacterium]
MVIWKMAQGPVIMVDPLADGFWKEHAFVRIRGRSRIPEEPEQILLQNRIYMGGVRSQDDIFEGHPTYEEAGVPSRDEVRALATRHMVGAPAEEIEAATAAFLANLSDDRNRSSMVSSIAAKLDAQYSGSSILSFFREIDQQRAWASYGEGGKGHAFVFDFRTPWPLVCGLGMPPIDAVPFPVKYVPPGTIPSIQINFAPQNPDDGWRDITAALLMKAELWSDQKEERLIRVGIPQGLVEFPSESLRAVVLGYDTPDEDVTLFKDLRSRRAEPIPLYRLEADRHLRTLRPVLI